ncbi:MAG: type III pantothenate kinase [Lachnospiraceae bacterium]|nr:type III pantothenate kinase [Lachnospiraceae bacterium]
MILAVDIGNTNIVVGCVRGDEICFVERLSTVSTRTELEYAISFKNIMELHDVSIAELDGGIISSVVPPVTNVVRRSMEKILNREVMVIGPGVKTGLNILMDDPRQVGSDRIVNAVAVINEYPVPAAIIDMGTATTICVVDAKKNYIGGAIIPGMRISADTLTARTAQLPKISLEAPARLIGKNTVDCMKSGVFYGNVALIDGMLDRMEEELGEKLTVVATGGLARTLIPYCKREIILDDALLLKGLKIIYEKNQSTPDGSVGR